MWLVIRVSYCLNSLTSHDGYILRETNAAINRTFPVNFKFGAASASYQVEGGWNEDGKSENIWDHICHEKPTYVANQDNGDIACDSYHKYKEDVAMLKDLGVDFYRFSISWSRVIPGGVAGSPVNQLGLDYYRNLVQELVDNGIEPMVTMFHWDLPEALQELGGWPNPELEDHFVYYARTLYKELGDLVKHWMTFNEPKQTCLGGYGDGDKAPGYTSSGVADYQCTHILLKTHAKAYHIYDEEFRAEQQGNANKFPKRYSVKGNTQQGRSVSSLILHGLNQQVVAMKTKRLLKEAFSLRYYKNLID
jgi:beta-glucosidase/6-phospho-beta-glucosidase/beta-galactosidase